MNVNRVVKIPTSLTERIVCVCVFGDGGIALIGQSKNLINIKSILNVIMSLSKSQIIRGKEQEEDFWAINSYKEHTFESWLLF